MFCLNNYIEKPSSNGDGSIESAGAGESERESPTEGDRERERQT